MYQVGGGGHAELRGCAADRNGSSSFLVQNAGSVMRLGGCTWDKEPRAALQGCLEDCLLLEPGEVTSTPLPDMLEDRRMLPDEPDTGAGAGAASRTGAGAGSGMVSGAGPGPGSGTKSMLENSLASGSGPEPEADESGPGSGLESWLESG